MALIGHQEENERITFPYSGALIDKRFVLTAAHCITDVEPVIVRLGITNLDNVEHSSGMVEKKIKVNTYTYIHSYIYIHHIKHLSI